VRAMRVVQLGVAQAHLHVCLANMVGRVVDHRAVLRANSQIAGIADGVAEEVGRKLLVISAFPQRCKGSVQLSGHRIQQNRRRRLLGTRG